MSTLSCSRWIFLLSLAALMLISASEGGPFQSLSCWEKCFYLRKQSILTCFEQSPRKNCETHGYVVETNNGRKLCITGQAHWIKKMIADGHLDCPHEFSMKS